MAVKYTPDQQNAIDSRGCNLIVSAAAGSGKTAVLVERVIQLICDSQSPCDIDELLVVTFTNAAAAEMREKIGAALLKRVASDKTGRLRRQLSLLGGAKIETVHAFCLDLIKENYALCGLPADFSVADTEESLELRKEVLDELLEKLYEEKDPDFMCLCASLSEEKGDRLLSRVLDDVYEKLISHPDPISSLYRFTSEDAQGIWKDYLLNTSRSIMEHECLRLEKAFSDLSFEPDIYEKYRPAFEYCLAFAQSYLEKSQSGWDTAYETLDSFSPPRLGAVRGEAIKERAEIYKSVKNSFASSVAGIKGKIITSRENDEDFLREQNLSALKGLRKAAEGYFRMYSHLKRKKGLLDFSDLEHFALGLLTDTNGGPSELALQISSELKEVLVDEYQDTNDIQDAIFSMLTVNTKSSFYVGDVKQSIYRFRMAKPQIFMEKYLSYSPFSLLARNQKLKMALNRNFRSRKEILDTCNHVFSAEMSRAFGDIDYTDEEALYNGAPYEGEEKTHFEIIDMQGSSDDDDSPEKAEAEAMYVAGEIQRMLKESVVTDPFAKTKRKAEYGDFAILLSSFANKSGYFIKELSRLNIPVSGGKREFWQSMEILVMMSFLRVLDNRRQDIPLIGLMRSPLFFFSADKLAEIRLEGRGLCVFEALQLHAQKDDHCRDFVDVINRYVSYVPDMSASQIIRMIYAERSVMAVFGAMDSGAERCDNLKAFLNLALDYESRGHLSLFDFIRFAEGMMEKGEAPAFEEKQGVHIMSIHKSKGLEFPFVFLPDLNKTFNFDDAGFPVVIHDKMGIGLKLRVRKTRAEYRTQMHRAVSDAIRRELASEEMRKLYVAMTRAREKLVMVASLPNADKTIKDIKADTALAGITPMWLAGKSNAAAWLIAAFSEKPCSSLTVSVTPYASIAVEGKPDALPEKTERQKARPELMELLRLSEVNYGFEKVSALPSKLTPASTRRLLENAGRIDRIDGRMVIDTTSIPTISSDGLTPLQRGSAIHLFLQKADFQTCLEPGGIEREKEILTAQNAMSPEEAQAVDTRMIEGFLKSDIYVQLEKSDRYIREYEFSAMMSPRELGIGDFDDQILMNGVIDLMIFDSGGIYIVDFKTDRVSPGMEAERAKRHALQLEIYALAAEKIFSLPVKGKTIFFLRSSRSVNI